MFVPYSDISEVSKKYISEVIKPKYIVAKHIPPEDFATESKNFLKAYPEDIVLENAVQAKSFNLDE